MCHLFFALPLLALPVFWLSPLSVALPLYGVGVSLLAYAYAWKAWRMPRMNGLDAMLGMQGKVVVKGAGERHALLLTARKMVDAAVVVIQHLHRPQRLLGPAFRDAAGQPLLLQSETDILGHGHVRP